MSPSRGPVPAGIGRYGWVDDTLVPTPVAPGSPTVPPRSVTVGATVPQAARPAVIVVGRPSTAAVANSREASPIDRVITIGGAAPVGLATAANASPASPHVVHLPLAASPSSPVGVERTLVLGSPPRYATHADNEGLLVVGAYQASRTVVTTTSVRSPHRSAEAEQQSLADGHHGTASPPASRRPAPRQPRT